MRDWIKQTLCYICISFCCISFSHLQADNCKRPKQGPPGPPGPTGPAGPTGSFSTAVAYTYRISSGGAGPTFLVGDPIIFTTDGLGTNEIESDTTIIEFARDMAGDVTGVIIKETGFYEFTYCFSGTAADGVQLFNLTDGVGITGSALSSGANNLACNTMILEVTSSQISTIPVTIEVVPIINDLTLDVRTAFRGTAISLSLAIKKVAGP